MIEVMSQAEKKIKLEEDQKLEKREKSKTIKKSKIVIVIAEPYISLS